MRGRDGGRGDAGRDTGVWSVAIQGNLSCCWVIVVPSLWAHRARRGACGRGMDQSVLLHTARTKAPALQERHELALDLAIPFDVALRHGETGMAGELLHVSETAPDLGDFTRGPGNERPAAGM